ncbi:unnamed protein product [Rotaria sp. Silwood2]|nr:unnamed protein product [Rotaria sp. Silwood2]
MSDTGTYSKVNNQRIQRWLLDADTVAGTTVAGASVAGVDGSYNTITRSDGLFVDSSGTLYVSDSGQAQVTKWLRNEVTGTLAAGNGTSGSSLAQLNDPRGIWVDGEGNLFVVDCGNHRVVKWSMNATSGELVAGGQGQGPFAVQLNYPTAITVDGYGNLYILDAGNQRIQQFVPGSLVGITIFDISVYHPSSTNWWQSRMASGSMVMDYGGNLYVVDSSQLKLLKISRISEPSCTGKF